MGVLAEFMKQESGCTIISVVLGLGLAAMFYKVCNGKNCIIMKGPEIDYVTQNIWKKGDTCFKYTYKKVDCPNEDDKNSVA
jgi:hypothetical protein